MKTEDKPLTFESELDKKVEITILKRKIEAYEKAIKDVPTVKFIMLISVLLGFIFGGVIYGVDSYNTQSYESYQLSLNVKEKIKGVDIEFISSLVRHKQPPPMYDYLSSALVDSVKNIINQEKVELQKENKQNLIRAAFKVFIIASLSSFLILFLHSLLTIHNSRANINKLKLKINEVDASSLKENLSTTDTNDFFSQLVNINFKYLDQYYLLTHEQAEKSFRVSLGVCIVGFTLIIFGIGFEYYNPKNNAGNIATYAGVISEFISAGFFYLYNKTIQKMSHYHQKLAVTQNVSLALRTADSLGENKSVVLEKIIDQLTGDLNKYFIDSSEK